MRTDLGNGSTGPRGRLRVLVIGAGLGGLCLAQGLKQAGFDEVAVFERDAGAQGRMQGYRLRISPEGERALRECLPPPVQELLTATSNARRSPGLAAYDEQLTPLPAPTFEDPRGDSPDAVDAVDRVTLRRVLLAGLDDVVHFNRRFVRCERAGRQVVAHFADGGSATADVLVAADGANSAVRAQLRPTDRAQDLGIRAILSRTPRAAAIAGGLPARLRDRFLNVTAADGLRLALMPMVFRNRPIEAAAELLPRAVMSEVEDYYMSVFSLHKDLLGLDDPDFFALSGPDLCRLVRDRTAGWHPDLRAVFAQAEPEQTHPLALRAMVPVRAWDPGPVIPLGDAVHLMPPTGGVGANTAVRDAAALCRALIAVDRGQISLERASAGYQQDMVTYSTEAVNQSLAIARWSMKRIDVGEQQPTQS